MAEEQRLGRDVFIALAAIGWADGKLDQDEADAIVRTALEEGLELDEIHEIEEATKERVEIGSIDLGGMTKEDRLFVYAIAAWMTRIDGKVDESETSALAKLGDVLKVPDGPRQAADAVALEVAELPEGDSPSRYDLPQVRKVIGERLQASAARRAAEKNG